MRKLFTPFICASLLLALLTGPLLSAQTTGSFNQDITFMGASRRLSCFVPTTYNPAVPAKLMIALHGLGDNSTNYRNALVGSLSFGTAVPNTILICPDGGSDPLSDFYTPVGDEAVIQASIDFARSGYNIDTTNIILQGFSLGGRSALRYGLDHTDQFKGLLLNTPAVQGVKEAVKQFSAGGLFDYAQAPQIPIYITHGNADATYEGPIDSTYEQLARNNGMTKRLEFSGGHTVPPFATQDFAAFFNQPEGTVPDVEVVKVLVAPQSCNVSVPSKVLVQNKGATTLSSIGLSYEWNGSMQHYTWNGSLPSFAHTEISLPAFTATAGNHRLVATADTLNGNIIDAVSANNTDSAYFRIYTTPRALPFREKFEDSTYNDRWLTQPSGDAVIPWTYVSELQSIACFNTIYIFENTGRREEFLSPALDLSSLSQPYLAFDVSYNYTVFTGALDTTFADTLEVLVSTDCGATYQSVYKKAGAALATFAQPILNPANLDAYLVDPDTSDWRRERIDLSAYAASNDAIVKFSYISGLGGLIYLSNIAFENEQTGIHEKEKPQVKLYPNPAQDQVILNTGDAPLESITVSDLAGRKMMQVAGQGRQTASVSTANLPNGVYLFEINTTKGTVNQKIVVQH